VWRPTPFDDADTRAIVTEKRNVRDVVGQESLNLRPFRLGERGWSAHRNDGERQRGLHNVECAGGWTPSGSHGEFASVWRQCTSPGHCINPAHPIAEANHGDKRIACAPIVSFVWGRGETEQNEQMRL
jgi:hypothetical protein